MTPLACPCLSTTSRISASPVTEKAKEGPWVRHLICHPAGTTNSSLVASDVPLKAMTVPDGAGDADGNPDVVGAASSDGLGDADWLGDAAVCALGGTGPTEPSSVPSQKPTTAAATRVTSTIGDVQATRVIRRPNRSLTKGTSRESERPAGSGRAFVATNERYFFGWNSALAMIGAVGAADPTRIRIV